jgi:tRNA threonylcarbamoyladenosine biosynthesis protein TsaB
MRLLALETATRAGGAALLDDGRLVGESRLNIALTHSERLMGVVDRLLQDCGWDVASLEALAVSIGPGSFTGLRVGAATAKGLALALELEVAPVPTLEARRDEVYCSLYRWTGRAMERQWDYRALSPEAAAARLEAPVIVLGDGVEACRPYLGRLGPGLREADPVHSLPSPAVVGALGQAILAAGRGIPAEELVPLYLRPSEAELKARHA